MWSFNEEDAVKVTETDGGFNAKLLPYVSGLPGDWLPGMEAKRDHAMAEALFFVNGAWGDTNRMNSTLYYTDEHGTWAVNGGDSYNPTGQETELGQVRSHSPAP